MRLLIVGLLFIVLSPSSKAGKTFSSNIGFNASLPMFDGDFERMYDLVINHEEWKLKSSLKKTKPDIAKRVINSENGTDRNLLYTAIDREYPKIVKVLLEYGADPNGTSQTGLPVVLKAIHKKDSVSLKLLLEHGADPNSTNTYGSPALFVIVGEEKIESEGIKIIKSLLENKADVNKTDLNHRKVIVKFVKPEITKEDVEALNLLFDHGLKLDTAQQDKIMVHVQEKLDILLSARSTSEYRRDYIKTLNKFIDTIDTFTQSKCKKSVLKK